MGKRQMNVYMSTNLEVPELTKDEAEVQQERIPGG